jgi:hypothetical protein
MFGLSGRRCPAPVWQRFWWCMSIDCGARFSFGGLMGSQTLSAGSLKPLLTYTLVVVRVPFDSLLSFQAGALINPGTCKSSIEDVRSTVSSLPHLVTISSASPSSVILPTLSSPSTTPSASSAATVSFPLLLFFSLPCLPQPSLFLCHLFRIAINLDSWWVEVSGPPGMCSFLTSLSIRTESSKVEPT